MGRRLKFSAIAVAAAVIVVDYVIRGRRPTGRTGLSGNLRRRRRGRPVLVELTVTDGAIDGRRFLPPGGQLVVDTFFQS